MKITAMALTAALMLPAMAARTTDPVTLHLPETEKIRSALEAGPEHLRDGNQSGDIGVKPTCSGSGGHEQQVGGE